ncbi:unnamed protein product [Orchesella dallaii]|uniref:Protein sleepless n=1 Tax=Orchesella dallaii TaxID=48710 RepID=A0ABP1S0B6_9HEXA
MMGTKNLMLIFVIGVILLDSKLVLGQEENKTIENEVEKEKAIAIIIENKPVANKTIENKNTTIKCYQCYFCKPDSDWKGEEKECEPPNDRCAMTLENKENGGWVNRFCTLQGTVDYAKQKKVECDDFGKMGQKWCFCKTDLCNDMIAFNHAQKGIITSTGGGDFRRHLIFTAILLFLGFLLKI